jgi:hypothetical protein
MNEELVLEAREVDWGHDVMLVRGNLERPVEERLERVVAAARLAHELQAAGRRG